MKNKDIQIYREAHIFLENELEKREEPSDLIEIHLNSGGNHKSINDLFLGLITSGANRNMMWNVINAPIGEIQNLEKILFNFNPKKVNEVYGLKEKKLLKIISEEFHFDFNNGKSGLWIIFSKVILSGAKYLSKFKDLNDFDEYASFFHNDERAKNALPLLLKEEINGFGLALACDFLKEAGYRGYGKPDIHIKNLFVAANLTESTTDYETLRAIERIARNNDVSVYKVDKLFWLIGSGKFYLKRNSTGKILNIGRNTDKFINHLKSSGIL